MELMDSTQASMDLQLRRAYPKEGPVGMVALDLSDFRRKAV